MQYPPYYYAKLLLATGDKEHFMKAFLPFARHKKNDFWVWDLMSDAFAPDTNEHFSCLCKSLSCGAPCKFIINVKEKTAKAFENKQMFSEAKREYIDIIDTRTSEGWNLSDKHYKWQTLPWWQTVQPTKNNFSIYNKNKNIAETLLYADSPETIIIVDNVNKEKSILSFVASKALYGFFNYKNLNIKPNEGEFYKVRFQDNNSNKSNYIKVLSAAKTEPPNNFEPAKTVSGKLIIHKGNSFGFIGNIFVPANIILKNKLQNNQNIKILAVNIFNKKRNEWLWKAIKVL